MSRLGASKEAIATILSENGLVVADTGKFAAPCVLFEPGEPWATVDLSFGRKRTGRWRLTLVAGRADSAGNIDKLMSMVDEADAALLKLPGVELPAWGKPFDATFGNVVYGVTQATIQYITQEV